MAGPASVAIVGMGARFPGAPDLSAFRRLVRGGEVHVTPVPPERWDHRVVHSTDRRRTSQTPAKAGAFMAGIDRFAPEFFGVTPRRARIMDPQQRLMLEITRQALEHAGYAGRPLAGGRVGVYVGASSSDHRTLIANPVNLPCDLAGRSGAAPGIPPEVAAAVTAALPPMQAYSIVGQQLNMIAANVSQAFDFHGPAFAVDTACSSALAALHEAVLHLRHGVIDGAVVGGVYVQLDPVMMVCFSRIGALSFSDQCRPFETAADGFVLGEGVGAVVLKRWEDAQRDGDRVIAVIQGVAMNNDGRAAGPLTPDARGQAEAIRAAWRQAEADPGTVGLLEAHATATPAGDGIELAAITEVFGSAHAAAPVPITSIKANIGHGLSSAGIASLIKAALAVEEGFIPGQPVRGPLRPEFDGPARWLRVPASTEPWPGQPVRRAGVSAFGFGGTNVHVVLESVAAPDQPAEATGGTAPGPIACRFSAPTPALLAEYLRGVAHAVRETRPTLADVTFTLEGRRSDVATATVLAQDARDFVQRAGELADRLERGEKPSPAVGGTLPRTGRLLTLPPSPLAERRFWLIDETKREAAVPTHPGEAPAVAPDAEAGPAERAPAASSAELARVVQAVTAVTAWRPEEVLPQHRLVGDLGFDSLTTLEFMTALGRALPGLPPPPRTLFTPALTVAELVAFVAAAPRTPVSARAPDVVFEAGNDPWLLAHRPGSRPLLPMTAVVAAVQRTLRAPDTRGGGWSIGDFSVLAPVEIAGERAALWVEREENGDVAVRAAEAGPVVATCRVVAATGALPSVDTARAGAAPNLGAAGALSLANFYAEFAFHGPGLQALTALPRIDATGASGEIGGDSDVVRLDGALQLALYWLAVTRKVTAVAVGFGELRRLAGPTGEAPAGGYRCLARLVSAGERTLQGDFDLFDAAGACVWQWRGVEAQVLAAERPAAAAGPAQWDEVRTLAARKAGLAAAGLAMPYFHSHDGVAGATTRVAGREYLNFSSYNYLGLAGDPGIRQASIAALERYGTSASASRVASGERPIHAELERALAAFLGCGDALALVSGHATNVSTIGHLFGPEDVVIHDQLAHDCIVTGARLSGARRLVFPHNDLRALEELLVRERPKARRALIAIEGVYSMDGDLAPLPDVVALKRRHDAVLLIDEAHSLGVIGRSGRGAGEFFGVAREDVDLWMGTLSKALASCGGYLAGAPELIDYLRFTLPGFVYSVGLPPANAAAGLAALEALRTRPELAATLQARGDFFRALCVERGVNIGASAHSAVVPCLTGSSERALRLAQALGERGINVQPIFHPAVEEGRARLRFFVTAEHTEAQLLATADALAAELAALDRVTAASR